MGEVMKFEVRAGQGGHDYGVFAVSPKHGNDAALLAVFDHEGAAKELAGVLNMLDDLARGN